jgi:hypothetical protein
VNVREASDINVKVDIGTVVPTTVERFWMPVPQEIVTIVPAWRSYRIVKVQGRLIIIEPATRKIVYVIES